jgi:glucosamine--fructose-6-phosphate aminotransferase (isomerizing)
MNNPPVRRGGDAPEPSLMLREAAEAPEVASRLLAANADACQDLAARLRASPPRFAVTCARGCSDSAATYAKYLLEIRLGLVAASVGPSVRSIFGAKPRMAEALFLAISQSGRSPDLVTLAALAREGGALTVALVNDVASPLAAECEVVLPLHAWPERSVAATKSYVASLCAVLQLASVWSGDAALQAAISRLPDDLDDALRRDWRLAVARLEKLNSLFVVGRGPGYAAAQEAALKLKETCGMHAEAISAAELLHGPLTLAGPDFPIMLFSQRDESLKSLEDLAQQLTGRNVEVIAAGPAGADLGLRLPTANGLHPFVQPIAMVQSFYPLAESLARARGRDPDNPPHLKKVTETR